MLYAPRMFKAASANCSTMRAVAPACHPHSTHSTLLARNPQKPSCRRRGDRDATNQAASTVTSIAGHCRASSPSTALSVGGESRNVQRRKRRECRGSERHGRRATAIGRSPFARLHMECAFQTRYRGLVNRARERARRDTRSRRKFARSRGPRIRWRSHDRLRRRGAELQLQGARRSRRRNVSVTHAAAIVNPTIDLCADAGSRPQHAGEENVARTIA